MEERSRASKSVKGILPFRLNTELLGSEASNSIGSSIIVLSSFVITPSIYPESTVAAFTADPIPKAPLIAPKASSSIPVTWKLSLYFFFLPVIPKISPDFGFIATTYTRSAVGSDKPSTDLVTISSNFF